MFRIESIRKSQPQGFSFSLFLYSHSIEFYVYKKGRAIHTGEANTEDEALDKVEKFFSKLKKGDLWG